MPPRRPSARLPAAKPTDVESKSAGLCYREQPSNATFESKSPHPRYCPVRYLVQNGIAASMAVIVQRLPIAASGGRGEKDMCYLFLGVAEDFQGKPCEDPATQLAENEYLLLQLFAMNISRAHFTGYSVVPLSDVAPGHGVAFISQRPQSGIY
ncbi:hypothetical protein CTAM01_01150 [Colletotrichum tamarilloi]|uniref:Uncharacterized protein n=1 Tax=Colletotrichum tamarilloi TaxID=1209934 RepID=A0ABQ9RT73_9PEZI|nr:uncharacterized protein CTAM01_01150 [Colletotrichum tamarilloi]KAK1512220.1 hypothetical protein CTAM01_01150 [Colletotrichum tamarilloi]